MMHNIHPCLLTDKSETDFSILINPDDVPELSEEITVTLTFVNPSDTQRLKYGSTQVKIIILENDNPGGTFQFSSEMQDSYQVQVSYIGTSVYWCNAT